MRSNAADADLLLAPFIWCGSKIGINLVDGKPPFINLDDDWCLSSPSSPIDDISIGAELYGISSELLLSMEESEYSLALFDDEDDLVLVLSATESPSLSASVDNILEKSGWLAVDFTQDLRLKVNGKNINIDLSDEFFVGRRLVHFDTQSNPERDLFMALFELSSQEDINEIYESLLNKANLISGTSFSLSQGDATVTVKNFRRLCFENILFDSNGLHAELVQQLLSATLSYARVELSFEIIVCHESSQETPQD